MFQKGARCLSVQGDRLYGSDMAEAMVFVVVVVTSADTKITKSAWPGSAVAYRISPICSRPGRLGDLGITISHQVGLAR